MVNIENILICLTLPLFLSSLFLKQKQRLLSLFILFGMVICLFSAYINSFFMNVYCVDMTEAAINITPVCEEVLKLSVLLFYILIWEPDKDDIIPAAIGIAIGFTTFENCCYMAQNGTTDFIFMLIRAASAGSVHLLNGIAAGYGLRFIWRRRWLAITGTTGVLGVAVTFHAIYNLLISASGVFPLIGYLLPPLLIIIALILTKSVSHISHRGITIPYNEVTG